MEKSSRVDHARLALASGLHASHIQPVHPCSLPTWSPKGRLHPGAGAQTSAYEQGDLPGSEALLEWASARCQPLRSASTCVRNRNASRFVIKCQNGASNPEVLRRGGCKSPSARLPSGRIIFTSGRRHRRRYDSISIPSSQVLPRRQRLNLTQGRCKCRLRR